MDLINGYKTFLDNGKTERECVTSALEMAQAKGFRDISTYDSLKPGDKVYVVCNEKSLALFVIGRKSLVDGIGFVTSHIDSPRLDLKMKPLFEKEGIVYLDTHYYGGIKKYQWVTMPLAIHGVVFRKDGSRVDIVVGEDEDDMSFCISDILPHMAQEQMKKSAGEFIEGEDLDLVVGLNRNDEDKDAGRKAIMDILHRQYGICEDDFLSAELEVVPAGRARSLGFDSSMVMAYGQDDRVCAYTSLQAILDIDQDLLKFTSLWVEYSQQDNSFIALEDRYSIGGGCDDYVGKNMAYADLNGTSEWWFVKATQKWNDKWSSFVRFVNVDFDTNGLDDSTEWGLGIGYQYTPAIYFELAYAQVDHGDNAIRDAMQDTESVIRFRTDINF